jgi:hypothetical protein
VIERVIENWLTSINERQYQIPFCQLLEAEGERVIYVSTHGQLELGVDVLSIDSTGTPRGYQLKKGDVALSDWRKWHDELVQLVESHPSHPALPSNSPRHLSFFVTNGTIKDPVLAAINQRNEAWKRRDYGPLIPIGKNELITRFREAHGKYLPESPANLQTFLELYTAEGAQPLAKERFAGFIERILPFDIEKISNLELGRACASAVLLTSYLTHNHTSSQNHWALFEAWVVCGAAILSLAVKSEVPQTFWEYSLKLCEDQAQMALTNLCAECKGNQTNFTQGSPLTDGHIYGSRMAILCGLIAVNRLSHVLSKREDEFADFADEFLRANWRRARAWGESAVPFFVTMAFALEFGGKQQLAEAIIQNVIGAICELNGPKGSGFPNPYWDPEKCLRLAFGLEPNHAEEFVEHSYTLQSLVQILARRWRRQALRSLWFAVTEIRFVTVIIPQPYQWLRWRSTDAVLDTRHSPRPQSWDALVKEATGDGIGTIPTQLENRPIFLLYFLLVYPHRFQPASVRLLDRSISSNGSV